MNERKQRGNRAKPVMQGKRENLGGSHYENGKWKSVGFVLVWVNRTRVRYTTHQGNCLQPEYVTAKFPENLLRAVLGLGQVKKTKQSTEVQSMKL